MESSFAPEQSSDAVNQRIPPDTLILEYDERCTGGVPGCDVLDDRAILYASFAATRCS